MSIFIGQDPVYQFNADGRLRRAFAGGLLYRSQHTTLAMLRRERTETQTLLLRTDLDDAELATFHDTMHGLLNLLHHKLTTSEFKTLRCVPDSSDHIPRILAALDAVRLADPWLSPAIRRRN